MFRDRRLSSTILPRVGTLSDSARRWRDLEAPELVSLATLMLMKLMRRTCTEMESLGDLLRMLCAWETR